MHRFFNFKLLFGVFVFFFLCAPSFAAPRFLTLPFKDHEVKLQQGWVYTFGNQSACGHQGIDYIKGTIDNSATWQAFDVVAAVDGEAVLRTSVSYGDYITIKSVIDGATYYTLYAHLDDTKRKLNLETVIYVTRGQVIGVAGKTGVDSNGVLHLHFELSKGGFGQSTCQGVNQCGTCRLDPYGIYGQRSQYPTSTTSPCSSGSYWTQCFPTVIQANISADSTNWHPDGTLLKNKDPNAQTVWLIQNKRKRAIPSTESFNANRLGWWRIINVSQTELDCYEQGDNLGGAPRLLKSNQTQITYLIKDNRYKSALTSAAVFEGLGYRSSDVTGVGDSDIISYQNDPAAPLLDSPFPEGTLVKKVNDQAVYVITNGKKRLIASAGVFEKLGYNWGHIISELSADTVDNIEEIPEPIDDNTIAHCNNGVTTFGGPDPTSTFVTTASTSSASPTLNQPTVITITVTNTGGTADDVIVDTEIYNSSGQKVFQDFRAHQYFATNQSQTYTSPSWMPSVSGQYRVKIGIFNSSWTTNYHWNDNALILNVGGGSTPPPANYQIDIWWPTDGAQVSGTQPFQAIVTDLGLSQYNLYWQVDNGQLNFIPDNFNNSPHKEVLVDLSGWNWRGTGPYLVNFVAKDLNGNTIAQRAVNIYVSP
jgi:hypothetical protein